MIGKRKGMQSVFFENKPYISAAAAFGGVKEGKGPLGPYLDYILEEDSFGEKTWEKAESYMLKETMLRALEKSGKSKADIDLMLSGDLLNQLMSSSFMARDLHLPFLGLYGACSTMAESMLMGAMITDGGFAQNLLAGASSHFCTAERQFRMPLEHGNQRPPSAQWTATAAGAVVMSAKEAKQKKRNIRLTHGTIGKVIDAGVKDANQMGSAMAPAAVDTILQHLEDTKRDFGYYDLILTGDLGYIGKDIAADLLSDAGVKKDVLAKNYDDCGTMIYDREGQDVHGGGSGCGCSAAVLCGKIIHQMEQGVYDKVFLVSTGAMLSTISPFQGESIPGIAHGVALEVC